MNSALNGLFEKILKVAGFPFDLVFKLPWMEEKPAAVNHGDDEVYKWLINSDTDVKLPLRLGLLEICPQRSKSNTS